MDSYAPYATSNPHRLKFVAVAEPDDTRRNRFSDTHDIEGGLRFRDWKELLRESRRADAALICTQDRMHYEPALAALRLGYHVLLEKPMSTDPGECVRLGQLSRELPNRIIICYVLRYTRFFRTIRGLLDEGKIGRVLSIQLAENVPLVDQVHAFVRGNWRSAASSSPMILAHCCHDMDLLHWFAGSSCRTVSSFGSLSHFRRENAPAGAPARCLDGCPHESSCPYFAPRIYLTEDTGWPASVISNDTSIEARLRALREGPYGRCVYRCDNDVVDHQVATFEFENEVTAAFTMCPFNHQPGRTLKLMGTEGEIRASMARNEIEVSRFVSGRRDLIVPPASPHRYGGGDNGIMEYLVNLVRGGADEGLTSAAGSVESHLMAFAAEKSRQDGKTVVMAEYRREAEEKMPPAEV
jgi:predicted dehydrogenase